MPYSNEVYNIAANRLYERRQNALRLADFRREQLFTEFPRLREINSELMSIGASIGKCIVKGSSQPDIRELSERSLSLQQEQDRSFADMGIDSKVLQPEFTCPVCGDTGHIELENRTVVCDCFKSSWRMSPRSSSIPICLLISVPLRRSSSITTAISPTKTADRRSTVCPGYITTVWITPITSQ